ncbi:MAG: sulfatase-like hydrolase/transferase [Oscillospiraceae bacterium]|nr:sulfatase-like hydrolase/transferase [Oscillospiraceae bacterium]
MNKKPNILLIMADELRADTTGFGGNPIVRTPNLDALAATSAVFQSAYTPAPICIPARQCIAAGQLPTTCKCLQWYDDLPAGYLTFPRLLSQYGYETVACGKLHHVGPDQMQGYTKRIGMECEVAQPFIPGLKQPRDAFSAKWSQTQEVLRATDTVKTFHIRQDEMAIAGAEFFIEQYFCDPFYGRNTPDVPLLLTASFNQPHYPYVADPALLQYYMDKVTPYENEPLFDHSFLSMYAVDVPHQAMVRATAAYYAMIETMDSYVGRLVSALTRAGQNLADWVILFTSDHGEMLGQHGVWEKQKFFEASARVPLFIHLPGQTEGSGVTSNVNLCDLYATICAQAQIPLPKDLDSRDLTPLVQGNAESWDNESVSIFDGTNIMIKRDMLKYQYYATDNTEVLFDLSADNTENANLIHLPQYAAAVNRFRQRIRHFGFTRKENQHDT